MLSIIRCRISSLLSKNTKTTIQRNVISSVLLYGCETLLLTLRKEGSLGVFGNRVLRIIFGHKRDELTRVWRKVHNEELNDLYSSTSIIRLRWAGHVTLMGRAEVYIQF
jgi:hypothetical protein